MGRNFRDSSGTCPINYTLVRARCKKWALSLDLKTVSDWFLSTVQEASSRWQVMNYRNQAWQSRFWWKDEIAEECPTTVKPSFHYLRWRPELTGDRFPLPVNTGRVDGRAFPLAELTGRQHGSSTRLVETGLKFCMQLWVCKLRLR